MYDTRSSKKKCKLLLVNNPKFDIKTALCGLYTPKFEFLHLVYNFTNVYLSESKGQSFKVTFMLLMYMDA